MFHYFNTVTDDKGNSLPGFQVEVVQLADGQTVVPIFADENGTPIETISGVANRAIADASGNYDFFVNEGTYSLRFYDAKGGFLKSQRFLPLYGAEQVTSVLSSAPVVDELLGTDQIPIVRGGIVEVISADDFAKFFDFSPPVFTQDPVITGTVDVGETLTATDGVFSGGSVTGRDWLVGGSVAASGSSYTIQSGDAGDLIQFRVTVTGAGGTATATSDNVGPVPAPSNILSVVSDGWRVTSSSPTDLSLNTFEVSRSGYNSSAGVVSFLDTLRLTKRVREDYPNQSTFTADQVAVTEPICASDTIADVTNNSSLVSPKPVVAWTMPHRRLVQSTVSWSLAAFHWAARNGEQVACVKVRATNGTDSTAFQTVSSSSVDTQVEDANPTALYRGDLDVSSLPDGGFWLEAEVYPHIGVASSVAKSEDFYANSANPREFTRRYFRKGSIPAWVAVESTGDDSTGAISTVDEATALATPCLTVAGALKKLRDNFGAVEGSLDGCRIVIVDAVDKGTVPFTGSYKQDIAGVVITRATGTTRANALMTLNANFRPDFDSHSPEFINEGSLIIEDCSIKLSGARSFQGEPASSLDVQIVNCNLDVSSESTLLRAASTNINYFGVTFTNYPSGSLQPLAANGSIGDRDVRINRGVSVDLAGKGYDGFVTIGSQLIRSGTPTIKDYMSNGYVWYNNSYLDAGDSGSPISYRPPSSLDGLDVGSLAVCQNVIEWTSTISNPSITISATDDYGDIPHLVVHHNTVAGVEDIGRLNINYDETNGSPRRPLFVSIKGNVLAQFNIKGMVFATDAANNGNEATIHGLSCAGNYSRDIAAGPVDSFAQVYAGVGSVIDGGPVLFTDNQAVSGTTASPVAGSGGSDLTLQSGSPAKDLFNEYLLSFDISGNARPTSGAIDAGAYYS